MSHSDSEADPLVDLAQEFADRYRRGERPSLSEYAGRYPDHAERIRRIFPALVAMERLGSAGEWSGGAAADRPVGVGPAFERLGEYRILREIARGGMGVVYEAVQESLGRHVALKVLPLHRLVRDSQLERFRREARAAARLHHSNIVPVFGVGECDGVHYYAMQYIQGQNLEGVLQEVRRLRGKPVESPSRGTRRSGLSASLARGLLSGRPDARRGDPAVNMTEVAPPATHASSPTLVGPNSSATGSDLAAQSDSQYARSVARIGLQVAEALAYAHQQGVLHRDIKPANILLDTQGTAWVTDFGLAKADDSAELTLQGDIVGTLRYMAPERFGGRADRRSDVYGLGLTLYEMLTLSSAFVSSDRARLVERVLHEEPPRPRKVDPSIPRDLETIVLKAMAKEPGRRYASAAALAEDLGRFLADRPIQARRAPAWERAWRLCRRNPALATSVALVVSLLAAIAIGSAAWTARLDAELRRTGEARRAEQASRKDALDKLWRSYLARAQAGRFGRRPGRRLDGLEALREAIPIARSVDAPRSSFDELRDEAVACLALPDLRPSRTAIDVPAGSTEPVFDGLFRRYALADSHGNVLVHRVGQRGPIARVTDLGAAPARIWISPDGRSLAIALLDRLELRDIDAGRVVLALAGKALRIDFAANSRRAAIGFADGTIVLADVVAGREVARFNAGLGTTPMALRPDGSRLAIADKRRNSGVEIWDLDPPKKAAILRLVERGPALALAWSPDGRRLGIGLVGTPTAEIWDVAERRPVVTLEGHAQEVGVLGFHPDGNLVLTLSYDGSARLWDVATGRSVVHWQSSIHDFHFGRDGKACGVVMIGGERRLLEVEPGREYRTLVVDLGVGRGDFYRADIGPDDLLAVGMGDGVRLWDLGTGRELAFLPIGRTTSANFISAKVGRALLSCGTAGLLRWPIGEVAGAPGRLRIGSPRDVRLPITPSVTTMGPDGRTALVADEGAGKAIVLDLETEAVRCTLAPHASLSEGFLSPDGRWAATGGWHTPMIKIWDARTGVLARDLPLGHQNAAFFSPDGHTLVTSLAGRYGFWDVPSWRPVRELRWQIPSYPGWVAFSSDRGLVALELSPAVVHLLDAPTGRTLARLQDPDSDRARWLGFTADGGRLVTVARYSKAIHVWDLREIVRQLDGIGLRDESLASVGAGGALPRPGLAVEITVDASASVGRALEQKARATIDWYRRVVAAKPDSALDCNNLAWAYLTAPESLRDTAQALALAQKAARLEPGNPSYRNTLGLAYYRAGRYREAAETLRADLESQEDRFLAWDLCFLAMSYHRLGETDRAWEYRNWALRWSRDQKGLSVEHLQELSAIREEMEATLAK
jgi:serine/threonine protein kinase/WD40 repeat protein